MNVRRYLRRAYLPMLMLLLLPLLITACGSARDAHDIIFWTSVTDDIDMGAQKQIVAEFEKANPGLHVDLVPVPTQFTGDATSLITAVRGGTAPDVYLIDRFTVSQFAAIGLLTDLSPMIAKNDPTLPSQYQPFATQEASYQGDLYALPMDTDARAVFYNKDLLRQAGIDPSILDPSKGPMPIDEMMQLAMKMDKTNAQGNYTELGLVPWDGQGFHATWGLDFGARFFNPQTCQVTPTEPGFMKAFESFAQWAKELNYNKVSTFDATYQPPNAPPSQTPFLTGHLGMMISGNWDIASLQEYAPRLNYGLTYLPAANPGDKPFTWSGGFGLVMPTGAANSAGGYRFMKFMSGPAGQSVYTQETGHLPTWKALLSNKQLLPGNQQFFAQMLKFSESRPPLPVGAQISDAMDAAQQAVLLGKETPAQALEDVYNRVQPQMQQYCPYHIG